MTPRITHNGTPHLTKTSLRAQRGEEAKQAIENIGDILNSQDSGIMPNKHFKQKQWGKTEPTDWESLMDFHDLNLTADSVAAVVEKKEAESDEKCKMLDLTTVPDRRYNKVPPLNSNRRRHITRTSGALAAPLVAARIGDSFAKKNGVFRK